MMKWQDIFYYDESSPSCLRWAVSRYAGGLCLTSEGDVAGTIGGQKYYRVQYAGKVYTVHRIIWQMHNGEIPDDAQIDHLDMCKTNNKLQNLRLVSRSLNCRNRPKRADNKSGITALRRRERILPSGNTYGYWIAEFTTETGKRQRREFAVMKYGEEGAKNLAVNWLSSFNNSQHGYTENHGI